jgi:nitrogen fixation protein NifQ
VNIRVVPENYVGEAGSVEPGSAVSASASTPAAIYQALTREAPESASIDADEAFDRHVLACILSVAASESGKLAERAGLSDEELGRLLSIFSVDGGIGGGAAAAEMADPEEVELIRDILLAHLSSAGESGRWLSAMIARRALEPNHLWEDLGLRNRGELTRLMGRHFASLAQRNDKNMRWKRFIYRQMCENDGFVMCATPICANCADYNSCFGAEEGVSRLSQASPSLAPGV